MGYDLRQQVYLFESISRFGSKHVSPVLAQAKVLRSAAIIAFTAAIIAYLIWRHRKARPAPRGPAPDTRARERFMATSLYELLEAAMSAQGIARGASILLLRHALLFKGFGHLLADEVLELTHVYLDVRFGGTSITEDDRKTFETRVKRVRAVRAQVAAAS